MVAVLGVLPVVPVLSVVVVVSCPVLSCPLVVPARGDLSASLGVIPSGSPTIHRNRAKRPETGQRGNQGKGARKLPIYIGIFRAFRSSRQKSKFRFGQPATGSLQGSDNSKF